MSSEIEEKNINDEPEDLPENFFDDFNDKDFLARIEEISSIDDKKESTRNRRPSKREKDTSPDEDTNISIDAIPGKRCSLMNKIRELEKDIARRRKKLKVDERIAATDLLRENSREHSRTKSPCGKNSNSGRSGRFNFKGEKRRYNGRFVKRSRSRTRSPLQRKNLDHNKEDRRTRERSIDNRVRSTKSTTRSISFLEELAQKFAEKGQTFPEMESLQNNFSNQNTNQNQNYPVQLQQQQQQQMDYNNGNNMNYCNPNQQMFMQPMQMMPPEMMYPMNNFMPAYNNYDGINYNQQQHPQQQQPQPQPQLQQQPTLPVQQQPITNPLIKKKNKYQKTDVFAKIRTPSPPKIDDTQNFLDKNMKLSVLLNTKVLKVQSATIETQTEPLHCNTCIKRELKVYEDSWTQTPLIEQSVIPTQTIDAYITSSTLSALPSISEMTPAQLMILNDFSKILRHSDIRVLQEIMYNLCNSNKLTNESKKMNSIMAESRNPTNDLYQTQHNNNNISNNIGGSGNGSGNNTMTNYNEYSRRTHQQQQLLLAQQQQQQLQLQQQHQQHQQQQHHHQQHHQQQQQSSSNSFLTSKQIMEIERNKSSNLFLNTNTSNKMIFDNNNRNNNNGTRQYDDNNFHNATNNSNSNNSNKFGNSQKRYNRNY